MNILESAYKQAIDEDAVMGAGDAAPAGVGDVSAPVAAVDNSVISPSNHMSHDDILGAYDPKKGVFGNGDFNLPKNVLGKGNMLKRMGYPSKKLKGHKNPYIKGMTVISEADVNEALEFLANKNAVLEGKEYSQTQVLDMLKQLKKEFKSPTDIDKFIKDHQAEIDNIDSSKEESGIISTAWKFIKYAASKGWQFVKKYWWKILLLILIIAAILWFGQTEQGIALGTKLFGKGYQTGVTAAKEAIKTLIIKAVPKAIELAPTLEILRKAVSWIPADPSLYPEKLVGIGLDAAGSIFKYDLIDGTTAYQFSGDDTLYIPQF